VIEVSLEGIRKSFARAAAAPPGAPAPAVLRGIDLTVAPGECFALLGPSGCGKTTLLRIVAGLERPDAGRVLMDGRDVTALPPERRPTAMVFQNYALFPHLSVAGNVAFGLRLRRQTQQEIARKVDEMLELVHLPGLQDRRIDELSGGQQQRVALARVLAVEPKVLLLDEPLSNLDAMLRRSTRSAIREIQTALGLTAIYITHDQEEALAISDRLALMQEGRIVQSGTPQSLFERPATVEAARFLGQRNVVAAFVRGAEGGTTSQADASATAHSTANGACLLALGSGESAAPLRVQGTFFPGVSATSPQNGDPVWLALLPRDIVLSPGGADGWLAEVTMLSFTGTETHAEVRLIETGDTLRAVVGEGAVSDALLETAAAGLRRGDRVRVRVRPGAGLIYRRQ
jgi:ABC-type Fe3+/spermidine/putrescine transport system ATPase subunit